MSERDHLLDCRNPEMVDFVHRSRRWLAAVGRVAELFLDADRIDPPTETAQEGAIVASLALQAGCQIETLRGKQPPEQAEPGNA
jgi:hypothetical protein